VITKQNILERAAEWQARVCPLAELRATMAADTEAGGQDRLEAVVLQVTQDLPGALGASL
jgi:hypothetical protein